MAHWCVGMVVLFASYVVGQVALGWSAVEILRRRVDDAWAKWLETSEPEDYETFLRLKDGLQKVEQHGGSDVL